jgi:hypothetical protein
VKKGSHWDLKIIMRISRGNHSNHATDYKLYYLGILKRRSSSPKKTLPAKAPLRPTI